MRVVRARTSEVSGELAGDGDHDDRAGLASGLERVPASVEPAGAAVGLGLDGLDQESARVRVAGLGDPALAAPLPA
jgi:hypothetical protein